MGAMSLLPHPVNAHETVRLSDYLPICLYVLICYSGVCFKTIYSLNGCSLSHLPMLIKWLLANMLVLARGDLGNCSIKLTMQVASANNNVDQQLQVS